MIDIDDAILNADYDIYINIKQFDSSEKGIFNRDNLLKIKNFVCLVLVKCTNNQCDDGPYDNNNSLPEILHFDEKQIPQAYLYIYKFYRLLCKLTAHYAANNDDYGYLTKTFFVNLLKIRHLLKGRYNLEVLKILQSRILLTDRHLADYYEKIAQEIERHSGFKSGYNDRCYIQKIKPFIIDDKIYYEVTFTAASDRVSKFDRHIAFTDLEITDNYAVKLNLKNTYIGINGQQLPVQVIEKWEVSIRPCEIKKLFNIFGLPSGNYTVNNEYRALMVYLTESKSNLCELVLNDLTYNEIRNKIKSDARNMPVFYMLDMCRDIILNNRPGCNILRYCLYRLDNKVINKQINTVQNNYLSNLYLKNGCIPFDKMPFTSSLKGHNISYSDLASCIDEEGREHEFLSRKLKSNAEVNGMIFTPADSLDTFENIDGLADVFNKKVYGTHSGRKIKKFKDYYYIAEYAENIKEIITKLKDLAARPAADYNIKLQKWLQENIVESPEKRQALINMFSRSSVAFIYGSAGTGKSTLINYISNCFACEDKLYLANTNPAVDNMKRKVDGCNDGNASTISRILRTNCTCDILFIDECSTVNNADMQKILSQVTFKLLVLVGDVYQIESIQFGNWFAVARNFLPSYVFTELKYPYRAQENEQLKLLWDGVRNLNLQGIDNLLMTEYSNDLDDTLFEYNGDSDEIILCLNYDGLYGINNINRFMQNGNKNDAVEWGVGIYKVGDRILFNEAGRFGKILYNNMKGKILAIDKQEERIWFDVELDVNLGITKNIAEANGFELMGQTEKGNAVIRFYVDKYSNSDEDDQSSASVMPFQVAYAVSIHKAQGLEYDSVKIVITNEFTDLITHDVFYTAITRTRRDLKIYWMPETRQKVLQQFKINDYSRDSKLLKEMFEI